MVKALDITLRLQIVDLHKKNKTGVEIASIVNCSQPLVSKIIKLSQVCKNLAPKKKCGRPRKWTKRDSTQLSILYKKNRRMGLKTLTSEFNEGKDSTVSCKTIGRKLSTQRIVRRVAKKSCDIRLENRRKRVNWCKLRRSLDFNFWRSIIFSDECQVVINQENKVRIWRKSDERYGPEQCCSKSERKISLMVWGCITFHGRKALLPVTGTINGQKYVDILQQSLPDVIQSFGGDPFLFQHDNAPVHSCRRTRDFLTQTGVPAIEWPPQSPDMNIIENVWLHCKRKLELLDVPIRKKSELFERFKIIWDSLPLDFIHSAYDSLPDRLTEVIRMQGHKTKY